MRTNYFVILCTLLAIAFWHGEIQAQGKFTLEVVSDEELPRKMQLNEQFKSANDRTNELQALIATLYKEGYLAASIDSLAPENDALKAYVHIGKHFSWAHLKSGNVDEEILSSIRFREKLFFGEKLNPGQVASIYSSILSYCENNGHPFAEIRMDSLEMIDERISASLYLEKNQRILMDSVVIRGNCKTAEVYLQNYIDIKPGDVYDESKLRRLDTRLRELPFITVDKPYYVLFGESETKLYLFLSDKKASQINGILGVLPDDISGKVTVTGDIQLKLKNALKRGELIDLNWRKLQTQTQDLKINLNYPYLFKTPFGTDLLFKLYKRDTTFLELNASIGLQYLMRGGDNFRVYYRIKSSDKLDRNVGTISDLADIKLNLYGTGVTVDRLDYKRNPRAGVALVLDGAVGKKKVSTDAFVGEDIVTTEEKSTQIDLSTEIIYHIPLGKKGTIRLGGQGGWMINDQLYTNELYRLGGIHSLRGTDEESIFASLFGIGTIEYRFLYETNANFHLFFDWAYYEDRSQEIPISDDPMGFGVGTSFETKAGIFSLNYALGRHFDNPIKFSAGKVHFGFVSIF